MFEQQNFVDLQDNESFGDPKSWLSGENHLSLPQRSLSSIPNSSGSNFDRVLYKNLVEMVPLVESLMDRKANTSFTRRASLIYTKTPSKKGGEPKGRKIVQPIPLKKQRDLEENNASKDAFVEDFSIISSRASMVEKDREELIALQEQVEDLQKKLLEKDDILKSLEASTNKMTLVNAKLDEMKRQVAEKESLIKFAHLQLSDAKIKLADKQATLEKIQWEATASNRKVETFQNDMESIRQEIAAFMLLLESLTTDDSTTYAENYDMLPNSDKLPYIFEQDDIDEMEMQEVEAAREAYISAVVAARENQDEESLANAAKARLRLHSLALRPKNVNPSFKSIGPQVF